MRKGKTPPAAEYNTTNQRPQSDSAGSQYYDYNPSAHPAADAIDASPPEDISTQVTAIYPAVKVEPILQPGNQFARTHHP